MTADEPSGARSLHALAGVLPVGVFLVLHLLTNARALYGEAAFARALAFWDQVPLAPVLEIALVLLPLLFHAGFGVVLMLRPAPSDSPYAAPWRPLLRGAAWVAFAFIAYHAYALGLPRWTHATTAHAAHTALAAHLSRASSAGGVLMPWTAFFYVVGLAATTLHFAAGTWGYLVRTGRVTTADAKRKIAQAAGVLGALLFGVSSATVITLATGSPLFVSAPEPPPCPSPPDGPAPRAPAPAASH